MSADRETFLRYYDDYKDRIMTYFWYRTGFHRETAEDCTQEAFLRAFRAFSTFNSAQPFGPWMYRIAHNYLVSHYRAHHAAVPLEEVMDELPASTREDAGVRAELRETLAGIAALNPDDRDLLLLRCVEGYTHEEIATIVGKRAGAVRVAVHRARERLRAQLSEA